MKGITKLLNKQISYSWTMEIFTNPSSYFQRSAYDCGTCSNLHTSSVSRKVSLNYQYSKQGCTSRFLGAFTTLRKATISIFMSVCPSVCIEQLFSLWTDFQEVWYLRFFRISDEKIQVSLEPMVFYMKTNVQFWSYLAQFFLE